MRYDRLANQTNEQINELYQCEYMKFAPIVCSFNDVIKSRSMQKISVEIHNWAFALQLWSMEPNWHDDGIDGRALAREWKTSCKQFDTR